MNRYLGVVFVGAKKETGEEEILECYMLAPWERKLDEAEAHKLLMDRITKYWDTDEQFWANQGYEDFGMKLVVVE